MDLNLTSPQSPYVGRFAPSPSGPLHFGSLVCALASYLDARQHGGSWLLRIEDIDPPREQLGAASAIKRTLEAHGLFWDGEVRYQSQRDDAYWAALNLLSEKQLLYPCTCTRKRLQQLAGRYDGYCREHPATSRSSALRLKVTNLPGDCVPLSSRIKFEDRICGRQIEDIDRLSGDFVIHRKDGLFSYQLAVVIDDIDQGITDVVRGDDLLDTTARQIFLYRILAKNPPSYAHIPVIRDTQGHKLSKQNHAPAVDDSTPITNLLSSLTALNIAISEPTSIDAILAQAIRQWHLPRTAQPQPR